MNSTLGVAVGLLLAIALGASLPVTAGGSGETCTLTFPGDACESGIFTYDGRTPGVDTSASLIAAGNFTVRIEELPPFTDYWTQATCTVTYAAGIETVECAFARGFGGTPYPGFSVRLTARAEGVAVPHIIAE